MLPSRRCRYCQQIFQPSNYCPRQSVCSKPECQQRRKTEYHRQKVQTDPVYAEVVRDSQKKWREAHPEYSKQYRQTHPDTTERNRQQQQRRDQQGRIQNLAKNNLALDLKRLVSEVWLVGPTVKDLAKNNLASAKVFIYEPVRNPPKLASAS
jgi:hypothetical protein